jgi:hypothetical protein
MLDLSASFRLWTTAAKGVQGAVRPRPDRHQVCKFHVLAEITKAILHVLAKRCKEMMTQIPKQPRGRPRKEQEGQERSIARRKQRVAELFEHRYLFVRHHLSPGQRSSCKS